MVGLTVALERIMPASLPLREMTVLFFIANEGFSIVENTAGVIPLPEKLKSVLSQLRENTDENMENAKHLQSDLKSSQESSEESKSIDTEKE